MRQQQFLSSRLPCRQANRKVVRANAPDANGRYFQSFISPVWRANALDGLLLRLEEPRARDHDEDEGRHRVTLVAR
jgi:hypothetical protein